MRNFIMFFDEKEGTTALVALLDRLTHHVHILEMNGESFRLRQSKTRNKNKPA